MSSPSQQPEPGPKRGRGKPFVKGDPRIASLQRKLKASDPKAATVEGPAATQQLRDMQHVYSSPASMDRTPGQKACRTWMNRNTAQFMASKTQLEVAANTPGEQPCPHCGHNASEPQDEETERRLNEITEQILRRVRDTGEAKGVKETVEQAAS